MLSEPTENIHTAPVGELEVRENELWPTLAADGECLNDVLRSRYGMAVPFQQHLQELSHRALIIDD